MISYLVKPYDVLFFRGNKSFDIGVWYSDGMFPPLPSTFQGFIRTSLLIKEGLVKTDGKLAYPDKAFDLVGDDNEIKFELFGPFVYDDELFVPTPLDLLCQGEKSLVPELGNTEFLNDLGFKLYSLSLEEKPDWAHSKASLMSQSALEKYRTLESPFVSQKPPVAVEDHVGIQLDYGNAAQKNKRTKEGMFYMTPYRRLAPSARLFFSTTCSTDLDGLSGKLGSEGRGAYIQKFDAEISLKNDEKFYGQLAQSKRFKLVLLQPGIFSTGWLPFPGKIKNEEMILKYKGLELKLLYARTGPSLRISGFSFRKLKVGDKKSQGIGLKPMLNAVPAGAVYYFEIINPPGNTAELLQQLDDSKIDNPETPYPHMGFNHVILAKIK